PGTKVTSSGVGDTDLVTVGNGGLVEGIRGNFTIDSPPALAFSLITVDDSADGAYQTIIHDTDGAYRRILGIGDAVIRYKYADTRGMKLRTGPGGGVVAVDSTGKPLTVESYGFNNTIVLAGLGNVDKLLAPLTVENPPSRTTVVVVDIYDAFNRIATL